MSEIVVVITGATGPAGSGGGSTALDDLTDVTITAAASGDILRHNGTAWVDTPGTTHFEAAGGIATHAALTSSVHGISAFGATLVDDADASAARTTLGLAIGTNVQAFDSDLAAIAALTSAADKMLYATGAGTWALADLTSAGRALLDDANAAAQRTTLGLAIGTDVQAYDADLAALAAISPSQGDIIYHNGTAWVRLAAGTSGHYLQTQGTGANPQWAAASGGSSLPVQPLVADTTYSGLPGVHIHAAAHSAIPSFTSTVADRAVFGFFSVTSQVTVNAAEIRVTTAGGGSAAARLGIYQCSAAGIPTTLTADFGTVSCSSTGRKTLTGLSQVLSVGNYFTVAVFNENVVIENRGGYTPWWSHHPVSAGNPMAGWSGVVFTYAALPGTAPTVTSNAVANTGGIICPVNLRWT